MTKSISRILQESLCSEKNFLEEDEYESTVADLQVRFSVSIMENDRPKNLFGDARMKYN